MLPRVDIKIGAQVVFLPQPLEFLDYMHVHITMSSCAVFVFTLQIIFKTFRN